MDYSAGLKPAAFKPDWFAYPEVKQVSEAFQSAGISFVFCGGAVRDAIDNRKAPKDFDIFANASAESVERALKTHAIDAGMNPHRKVTARIGKVVFDIFTRPPSEDVNAASWLSPEALRDKVLNFDFNINTLILTPEGQLYDFFGGMADIRAKRVRCVVDPMYSIDRGIVRILRYFRFCAEYGDSGTDSYALEAIRYHRHRLIPSSDKDRKHIRVDMFALLSAAHPSHALSLMQQCDVLSHACGAPVENLAPVKTLIQLEGDTPSSERIPSRIMALLMGSSLSPVDALESFAELLSLSERLHGKIKNLLNLLPYIEPSMSREKRRGLIKTLGETSLDTLLLLRCASQGNTQSAQELYLSLMQAFSRDGYTSPRMADLYVSLRGGYSPYTLCHLYGFTLIEMSIVLVIIGLVVGGVLVGHDLIKASEIRATLTQLEKYNTAANTFYGKYQALPGDVNQAMAQQFNLTSTATAITVDGISSHCINNNGYPGDGNGIVGLSGFDTAAGSFPCGDVETLLFWQHLKDAGLFSDPVTAIAYEARSLPAASPNMVPALKFGAVSPTAGMAAGISVFTGTRSGLSGLGANHLFWITADIGSSGLGGAAVLLPSYAYAIDLKIDDALPLTGTVEAVGDTLNSNGGPSAISVTGAADCVNSSSAYNTTQSAATANGLCGLVIKAAF